MSTALRREIEAVRPPREIADPMHPVAAWYEWEPDGYGDVVKVAALILTSSECPWRCAMCDLWKHTLANPTPAGAIPMQIALALRDLPQDVRWIKLYNSGSFFDRRSVPREDYDAIAKICSSFERVIIENHPKLSTLGIREFEKLLRPKLEIAIGVETLQTGMLRRLNKGMNRDDIDRAIAIHNQLGIDTRAFLLIRPPYTLDDEASRWTTLSIRHLARLGVRHASLIPVRAGNGWLDSLSNEGKFAPPTISAIEQSFESALQLDPKPVVTLDLWDWPSTASSGDRLKGACPKCIHQRRSRLDEMNLSQKLLPSIECQCRVDFNQCTERRADQ